jgi:hypothetical protein
MIEWMELVLAARRKDPDNNFFEVLIFIIIAVVYALGGILKAKSSDKKKQKWADKFKTRSIRGDQSKFKYKPLEPAKTTHRDTTRGKTQQTLPYAKHGPKKRFVQTRKPQPPSIRPPQVRQPQRPVRPEPPEPVRRPQIPEYDASRRPPARAPRPRPAPAKPVYRQRPTKQDHVNVVPKKKPAPAKTAEPKAPPPAPEFEGLVSLTHLAEPDNIRTAILYSEILGKPLAFRD